MKRIELARLVRPLRRKWGSALKLRLPALMFLGALVACACLFSTASARSTSSGAGGSAGRPAAPQSCGSESGPCTLSVSVSGSGTVTGSGGIDCPGKCSASYRYGTTAGLTATLDDGFVFDGW